MVQDRDKIEGEQEASASQAPGLSLYDQPPCTILGSKLESETFFKIHEHFGGVSVIAEAIKFKFVNAKDLVYITCQTWL